MNMLSRRWIAAARLSSRLDFGALVDALGVEFERCGLSRLVEHGMRPSLARQLCVDGAEHQPFPFRTLLDPGYPTVLRELARPPAVVWLEGDASLLARPGLAVVGSRSCTPYGRSVAGRVGAAVAQAAGVLVSGAARGIDSAAHRAALDAEGATLAVLGSGLGRDDRKLVREISRRGLLLSELPPDDPAARWTFPARNRLIAALSVATVVCEAGRRSGALHTANAALVLGRDLLVVPDRVDAPASQGALRLLREGAEPLLDAEQAAARVRPRTHASARVLGALDRPRSLAELAQASGLPPRALSRLLAGLELTGSVRRLASGLYGRP